MYAKPSSYIHNYHQDYQAVVKKPMDIKTIQSKFEGGGYQTVDLLVEDFALVTDNAFSYYARDSEHSQLALALHRVVMKKYTELKSELSTGLGEGLEREGVVERIEVGIGRAGKFCLFFILCYCSLRDLSSRERRRGQECPEDSLSARLFLDAE